MRRLAFLLPSLLVAGTACQRPTDRGTTAPPMTTIIPDAPLRNTRWVLRQVGSQQLSETFAEGQEPFLFISGAGTAEGQGGCNRFRGSFFSETAGELKFSPLMSTRMSCPAINIESDFMRALGQARTYRISGDTLRVLGETGSVMARLEAVYLR